MRTISNIFKDYIMEKIDTPKIVMVNAKATKSQLINYPEVSNTMHKTADTTAQLSG